MLDFMLQPTDFLMVDIVPYLAPYLDFIPLTHCWSTVIEAPIPLEFSPQTPIITLVALYVQARQLDRLALFLTVLQRHYPELTSALMLGFPQRAFPALDYAANLMELADYYLDQAYLVAQQPALPSLTPPPPPDLAWVALPLYQEAAAIIATQCGRQDSEYWSSLRSLANCYRQLSQTTAAINCYQEILTMQAASIGRTHSQYAQCLNELALIYSEQQQHELALQLSTAALAIRQPLGQTHPDYINGLCHLAYLQRAAGQLLAAQTSYQQALQLSKQELPIPNQLFNNCLQALGYLYRVQGQHALAIECYQELAQAQADQNANPTMLLP